MSRVHLDGATVLITGASSGIGLELAKQLGSRAKAVILVARRAERLEALKAELESRHPKLKILVFPCDITDQARVDEMLAQAHAAVGTIDILINNAGMGDIGPFATSDWAKQVQMMNLNMIALSYLTRQLIGPMIQNSRGGILMVGSSAAFQSVPFLSLYSATKYFVNGFSEALRAEVAHKGVVITQLCPGPVATEFGRVADRGSGVGEATAFRISAERCVREALVGFERGRAVVIPGWLPKIGLALVGLLPKPLVRFVLAQVARRQRLLQSL